MRMVVAVVGCTVLLAGCGPGSPRIDLPDPIRDDAGGQLPRVQVEQVAGVEGAGVEEAGRPLSPEAVEALSRPGERVTMTAVGTDLRSLLAALAEAAGVSLVVGPAVEGRVTVRFEDAWARDALEAVVRETGYMIARPLTVPWPPTVFYVVPVNVNEADAATIQARFGVSAELARFLVRSRIPPS